MIKIEKEHSIQKQKAHDAPFVFNLIFYLIPVTLLNRASMRYAGFYATRVDSTARANDLLLSRLFSAVRNVSLDKSDR